MTHVRMWSRLCLVTTALTVAGLFGAVHAQAAPSTDYVHTCSDRPAPHHYACFALRRTDVKTPSAANATPAGYSPASLRAAYNLPSASATSTAGSGKRVFVIDAFDDPSAEADLAAYRSQYGMAPCTTANGCFVKMSQTGSTTTLPAPNVAWAGETSLDLDMVSASCPLCAITLIESNDDGDSLFTAINLANSLGAKFVSLSWGGNEVGSEASYDSAYFSHLGVAYVVASGDGAYNNGIDYPSSSPNVISVGGTSLVAATNARGWSESAWKTNVVDGTGSGCSSDEIKPTWQAGIDNSICAFRADNDVSVVADPRTGVAVYQTYGNTNPGWAVYGGTSAGAPFVAGIYALAGAPITTDNPASYLWEHPGSLNDITTGDNGSCTASVLCTAGPGWDEPTGLGTPNGIGAFVPVARPSAAGSFVPLTPVRILDTRSGAPVPAGGVVHLGVTGSNGLPYSGVSAVVVNLTVADPQSGGFLTAYPDGTAVPLVSNINFLGGQTVPNLAVIPVGADGRIALRNNTGNNASANLIADLTGYFVGGAPATPGAFGTITPTRLLDTRNTTALGPGAIRTLHVTGTAAIPTGVSAVVVNLTATQPQTGGYLTAYAAGSSLPGVSNLNFAPSQTVANLAVVPVDSNGNIALYNGAGGTTQVIVDATGYYLSGSSSGTYGAVDPTRILDTRLSSPVVAQATLAVHVTGTANVPSSGVAAVVVNVTVTQPLSSGFLTVYPFSASRPLVSNVNFGLGQTVANLVVVPVDANGNIGIFNGSGDGSAQVIVDVTGYYRS